MTREEKIAEIESQIAELTEKVIALKESEYFDFGDVHKIHTGTDNTPIFIGKGLAPHGFSGKCLVVFAEYELETEKYNGNTILKFRRK